LAMQTNDIAELSRNQSHVKLMTMFKPVWA
jgi:hypothetical protein